MDQNTAKQSISKTAALTQEEMDAEWFWPRLDKYLANKGLKQTKQRKIVVSHFLHMNTHIEAEKLYDRVRNEGHNIGLATIYRTLNLLHDAGLIQHSTFSDGRSVFELLRPGTHHDHLVCISCGKIEEFENSKIEDLQRLVAEEFGYELFCHRLDLYGKCPTCRTE
jgi:Fur family ferric uptake transcriptional regulator